MYHHVLFLIIFNVSNVQRSCLVMSDSLWPHGLHSTRLLCSCDSPDRNTGVGCHSLLQRIFPTLGTSFILWLLYIVGGVIYQFLDDSYNILYIIASNVLNIVSILNFCWSMTKNLVNGGKIRNNEIAVLI